MPKTHVVQQGEHLSGIAARHGFGDWHIIWNAGANAALKALRDPHILFPGDKIVIPDRALKVEQVATTRVHTFQINLPRLFLRLKIHDVDDKAIADSQCDLGLDEDTPFIEKTDAKGFVEHEILKKELQNGEAVVQKKRKALKKGAPDTIDKIKYDLKIGSLDPPDKLSGQQARLNNLGYFAGFTQDDLDQFLWAVEEFQCDHVKGGKRVKITPEIEPQLKDDPPEKKTGLVKDADTRQKLEKLHGC